jgi:hypothetical protein
VIVGVIDVTVMAVVLAEEIAVALPVLNPEGFPIE